ncbi:MAG: cell envelope integrity protein CreD [Spirochaetaceae bacterium]|nr:cell envelope integrity protein CreD [Spirochaetaceae bacterium]
MTTIDGPDKKAPDKKFTKGYTFKVIMLAVLVLLLLIPLTMIRGLVGERSRTAQTAENDIMEAWGAELSEGGPVLRIPGVRTVETRTKTEKDGETVSITEQPFTLVVTPETLAIKADFKTEVRKRGIFSVPLFYGELNLSGTFDPSRAISSLMPNETLQMDGAELVISLSSQKGIRKINKALWNGAELFFQPGSRDLALADSLNANPTGIYAAIPDLALAFIDGSEAGQSATGQSAANSFAYDISIAIQGGKSLRVLPIGKDTHVEIASDWSTPSFQGAFLPGVSTVSDTRFTASWDVSYLSRTIPLFWQQSEKPDNISASAFGVDFYRQIDTYSLNIRAVKYAIIFLVIPFLTLFLLEIFIKTRIHPVPYLLSGIGNIIFYLLLLSLSEQISFFAAYLIAAAAVTAMLTLYARTLVTSWNRSAYMGFTVTVSYVLFYAVLNAESYALLIGSIGAFVIVALVMFLTRKLSWYGDEESV